MDTEEVSFFFFLFTSCAECILLYTSFHSNISYILYMYTYIKGGGYGGGYRGRGGGGYRGRGGGGYNNRGYNNNNNYNNNYNDGGY